MTLIEEEILALEQVGLTLRRDSGGRYRPAASNHRLPRAAGTVGELGILDNEPRSATVTAWGEVEALLVPAAELQTFLDEHRRAERALHRATRKRLSQATRKISDSDLAMERRLAIELVKMVENGIIETSDGVPTIGLSQKDLASLTGASHEAIKKIVRIFKTNGFIDTGRLKLRITDVDALRRVADGQPVSSW